MHLEYPEYKKTYTGLLLLWTMILSSWGNQTLIAAKIATEVSQTKQEVTSQSPRTLNLTTTQQQWLDRELQKCHSHKKQLKKLLAHINNTESFIRLAAYQRLCQLLKDHPKLANKKALQYIKKIVHKMGVRENTKEAILLVNALVNTNPKLVSPIARLVAHLTKVSQQPTTDEEVHIGFKTLTLLIPTMVKASPSCVPYLIKQIHQRTRAASSNYATSSSDITILGLNVIELLLQTDIVRNNAQDFDQVLEIVLDGASLHNIEQNTYPFKNPKIQAYAQTLLKIIIQQYPDKVQNKCDTFTKQAKEEIPDTVALVYLTALTTVDYQHTTPLLTLFKSILEATNTRVQILTDREYNEQQRHRTSTGLIGLITDVLVDASLKSTEKKLIKGIVVYRDDRDVRVPLLRLLREISAYNKSYLTEELTIIRKVLDKDEKSDVVHAEALDMFSHIVNQDDSYRREAASMVSQHTQVKSIYVREAAFRLLQAILRADEQYATDTKVLGSLRKFKQDKSPKIRQKAEELFSKYLPKTL